MKLKDVINLVDKALDKDLFHYASSLSFHTMLSIIPVLLISLSIFTNMPSFADSFENIKSFIMSSLLPSHQDVISGYIDTFLENTVKMGVMGVIVVLFVAAMFFKDYQYIINKIMHASPRSFWQALSTYWTLITLAPIALGASFYLSSLIQNLLNSTNFTSSINFLSIFPYLVVWVLFFTIYMISSSTQLSIKSGLFSSFVASLTWYITKNLFVYYVAYNKTYLSIYGSFSVVLFFFVWIYASWVIFLYGVKLCYLLHVRETNKKVATSNSEDNKHEEFPSDAQESENSIEAK
ncbi:MAG: YihY family inner membrane protein [Campylobacteraceae bacterium]